MGKTISKTWISHIALIGAVCVVIAGCAETRQDIPSASDQPVQLEKPDTDDPMDALRQAAEQGDANAQLNLGVMYYEGHGVPQDSAEAVKWWRKAAEQGYAEAQVKLGIMYHNGKGVPRDYTKALKWFRKAAEQGLAEGQFMFGFMHYHSRGVSGEHAKGLEWVHKAAEQGLAVAQHNLGNAYNVSRDYTEAAKWWRKAAEQGYAESMFHLGEMYKYGHYRYGHGVPQDYVRAHMWYSLLVAQGHWRIAKVRESLDAIEAQMTPEQLEEAKKLAREWESKPPDAPSPNSSDIAGGVSRTARQIAALPDYQASMDYDQMHEAFKEIDKIAKQHLSSGMTHAQVQHIMGDPQRKDKWFDRVEVWTYLLSISGTWAYITAFLDGKLEYFGSGNPQWLGFDDYELVGAERLQRVMQEELKKSLEDPTR